MEGLDPKPLGNGGFGKGFDSKPLGNESFRPQTLEKERVSTPNLSEMEGLHFTPLECERFRQHASGKSNPSEMEGLDRKPSEKERLDPKFLGNGGLRLQTLRKGTV